MTCLAPELPMKKRQYVRWTAAMKQHLRDHYPQRTVAGLAVEMGLSKDSVANMLVKLELRRSREWTDDEVQLMIDHRDAMTVEQLSELTGHPAGSVQDKLRKLGLVEPNWTADEDTYLRRHYGPRTAPQVGGALGRSPRAVRQRARRLGLARLHVWTQEEDNYLRAHYPTNRSAGRIAQDLGLTKPQIHHRARTLNLVKRPALKPEAEELLWELRDTLGMDEYFAQHFGVPLTSIRRTIDRLRDQRLGTST